MTSEFGKPCIYDIRHAYIPLFVVLQLHLEVEDEVLEELALVAHEPDVAVEGAVVESPNHGLHMVFDSLQVLDEAIEAVFSPAG